MFKITFEAKNIKDLHNQVNNLLEEFSEPSVVAVETVENITPDPVPVPTSSPVVESCPTPVVASVMQPSVPTPVQSPVSFDAPQEVDADGVRWDKRIHASSKVKVNSGVWKKRKNVDAQTVADVMCEIAGEDTPTVVAPPVLGMVGVAHAPPSQAVSASYTPVPVPQSTKPAHTFETFKVNFLPVMSQIKREGKVTPEYIESLKAHFAVDELWEISEDDTKMRELFDNFCNYGFITKVD